MLPLTESTVSTTTTQMPVEIFVAFKAGKPKTVASANVSLLEVEPNGPAPVNLPKRKIGEQVFRHMNPLGSQRDSTGATTIVEVSIKPKPSTAPEEMDRTKDVLDYSVHSGDIEPKLQKAIQKAVGIKTEIDEFTAGEKLVDIWSIPKCVAHMSSMAKKFSVAYTRRMVPTAIFNECTNFLPALTFSADMVPTALDVARCRQATVDFVKHWNYGGHGKTKAEPNFGAFCLSVCEFKHGHGSPKCVGQL